MLFFKDLLNITYLQTVAVAVSNLLMTVLILSLCQLPLDICVRGILELYPAMERGDKQPRPSFKWKSQSDLVGCPLI